MKNIVACSCLLISAVVPSLAQSNTDDVKKCEELVKMYEARAIAAEQATRLAEADAKNKRYVAVALDMAEQSMEMPDRELATLLAVLSYNFNKQHTGITFNNKIYAALANSLKLYNRNNGDKELKNTLGADIRNIPVVLPDGHTMVAADENGNLRFLENGMTKMTLSGHRAQVSQIRFNQAGTLMITAASDNTIRIWNMRMLNLRPLVISETAAISNLTVSPDDKQIIYAIATKPKTIKAQYLDTEIMADELCKLITRNLSEAEWTTYVGADLAYESVCKTYPLGK